MVRNQWTHVALVYDKLNLDWVVYQDGKVVSQVAASGSGSCIRMGRSCRRLLHPAPDRVSGRKGGVAGCCIRLRIVYQDWGGHVTGCCIRLRIVYQDGEVMSQVAASGSGSCIRMVRSCRRLLHPAGDLTSLILMATL